VDEEGVLVCLVLVLSGDLKILGGVPKRVEIIDTFNPIAIVALDGDPECWGVLTFLGVLTLDPEGVEG